MVISHRFNNFPNIVCSGWGLKEEMKTRLDIISLLPITDTETLQKIDDILSKRKKSLKNN